MIAERSVIVVRRTILLFIFCATIYFVLIHANVVLFIVLVLFYLFIVLVHANVD